MEIIFRFQISSSHQFLKLSAGGIRVEEKYHQHWNSRNSAVCDLVVFNASVGMISKFFFIPSKLAPLIVVQCRWFKFFSPRCACFSVKMLQNLTVIVSSKLRQLILVLNNIAFFKPIICHVCRANCVDMLVFKTTFVFNTFFEFLNEVFFNSLSGRFFSSKYNANLRTPTPLILCQLMSMFQHSSTNIQFNSEQECSQVQLWRQYLSIHIFFFQPVNTS